MEKEAEVVEAEEAEAPEAEAAEKAPEVESKAREMGWKPKEDWKGDPANWRPAEDFVRRGEEILPIVRSRYEKRIADLEADNAKERAATKESLKRIERMSSVALAKQREQLEADFASRKETAVERGDVVAYREAEKAERAAIADLDKRMEPDEKKSEPEATVTPGQQKIIDAWVADNTWFKKDAALNAYANEVHTELLDSVPGMTLAENLKEVRARVKVKFPEKFGVKEPNGASRVEGGSRSTDGGVGKGLYSKLPADAKAQCDKFITKDKLFLKRGESVEKDMGKARERYAKEYLGDTA